jgi:hypothetical protein
LIDVDFGPVETNVTRLEGSFGPTAVQYTKNGVDQIIWSGTVGAFDSRLAGSFIQYQLIDLSFMTKENEVMQPINLSVQRTSPVPLGYSQDGNSFDQIEEYIFVFTRPLNNTNIANASSAVLTDFRMMGLDRAEALVGFDNIEGLNSGWPSKAQTIYAEKRMYNQGLENAATITNGALTPASAINELIGMPTLASVTSWGSMDSITGPGLHCYRVVIDYSQTFAEIGLTFTNESNEGATQRGWPPVNVEFLCKDPDFSEGEYLTRIANAMNSTPEGGNTA